MPLTRIVGRFYLWAQWSPSLVFEGQKKAFIHHPIKSMSEKLCLQWNDFKENVNSAFGKLRSNKEFTDVTLVCEDGHQMEAHKVILASSSPFFEKILLRSKHSHPLIYLTGFLSKDFDNITQLQK